MVQWDYPGILIEIGGGMHALNPGSPFPKEINPILPSQLINTKWYRHKVKQQQQWDQVWTFGNYFNWDYKVSEYPSVWPGSRTRQNPDKNIFSVNLKYGNLENIRGEIHVDLEAKKQ